jgi:hypothetical protein
MLMRFSVGTPTQHVRETLFGSSQKQRLRGGNGKPKNLCKSCTPTRLAPRDLYDAIGMHPRLVDTTCSAWLSSSRACSNSIFSQLRLETIGRTDVQTGSDPQPRGTKKDPELFHRSGLKLAPSVGGSVLSARNVASFFRLLRFR